MPSECISKCACATVISGHETKRMEAFVYRNNCTVICINLSFDINNHD